MINIPDKAEISAIFKSEGVNENIINHGEILAALIALRTGRPSKLTYTRDEVFEATYTRHSMRFDLTMGADEKGIIKVMDMELLSNTGAYGEHAALPALRRPAGLVRYVLAAVAPRASPARTTCPICSLPEG